MYANEPGFGTPTIVNVNKNSSTPAPTRVGSPICPIDSEAW